MVKMQFDQSTQWNRHNKFTTPLMPTNKRYQQNIYSHNQSHDIFIKKGGM